MGCGDVCPIIPGVHYEDWPVGDPAMASLRAPEPSGMTLGRAQALDTLLQPTHLRKARPHDHQALRPVRLRAQCRTLPDGRGIPAAPGGDRIEVRSAGSMPADQINPVAVEAMAEVGVDIAGEQPKVLTTDAVQASDVVITMGCGDTCPYYPGKRYEDWVLADPAGQGIESVRPIRDEIRTRVEELIRELLD